VMSGTSRVIDVACAGVLAVCFCLCGLFLVLGAWYAGLPPHRLPGDTAVWYLVRELVLLGLIVGCLWLAARSTTARRDRGGGSAAWKALSLVLVTGLLQVLATMNAGDAACLDTPPCGVGSVAQTMWRHLATISTAALTLAVVLLALRFGSWWRMYLSGEHPNELNG
jgi:hypothetical protein